MAKAVLLARDGSGPAPEQKEADAHVLTIRKRIKCIHEAEEGLSVLINPEDML